jgi:hypothetical protein
MAEMVGMMSGGNDFSWNSDTIFDKIGNPEKREEYLSELSGTGNNEREMIEQLRSLTKQEMKAVLYDLPPETREEFINDYYGIPKINPENMSASSEMTITGPETAPTEQSGMLPPLELKASVNF